MKSVPHPETAKVILTITLISKKNYVAVDAIHRRSVIVMLNEVVNMCFNNEKELSPTLVIHIHKINRHSYQSFMNYAISKYELMCAFVC